MCLCAMSFLWAAGSSSSQSSSGGDGSSAAPVDPNPKLLRITATVDGSGRLAFTLEGGRYHRKYWDPPSDMTIDGVAWTDLSKPPPGWEALTEGLDLTRARIVKREGRDLIALELTDLGFDLYLCDTPNGAAAYEVTIAIPHRL